MNNIIVSLYGIIAALMICFYLIGIISQALGDYEEMEREMSEEREKEIDEYYGNINKYSNNVNEYSNNVNKYYKNVN